MSIANPYVKFCLHRGGNGEIGLISAIFHTSNTLGGHSHINNLDEAEKRFSDRERFSCIQMKQTAECLISSSNISCRPHEEIHNDKRRIEPRRTTL